MTQIVIDIPYLWRKNVRIWNIYGFRTAKTLSSNDIWYPANRRGGLGLFLAGIVTTIFALMLHFKLIPPTGLMITLIITTPVLIALIDSLIFIKKLK